MTLKTQYNSHFPSLLHLQLCRVDWRRLALPVATAPSSPMSKLRHNGGKISTVILHARSVKNAAALCGTYSRQPSSRIRASVKPVPCSPHGGMNSAAAMTASATAANTIRNLQVVICLFAEGRGVASWVKHCERLRCRPATKTDGTDRLSDRASLKKQRRTNLSVTSRALT